MDSSLELLSQLDAITKTFLVPAFFPPSHMNTVRLVTFPLVYLFIHSCLFVCLFVFVGVQPVGQLVGW